MLTNTLSQRKKTTKKAQHIWNESYLDEKSGWCGCSAGANHDLRFPEEEKKAEVPHVGDEEESAESLQSPLHMYCRVSETLKINDIIYLKFLRLKKVKYIKSNCRILSKNCKN